MLSGVQTLDFIGMRIRLSIPECLWNEKFYIFN
jgi:hypothetical protein